MIIGLKGNGPSGRWTFRQMDWKIMGLSEKWLSEVGQSGYGTKWDYDQVVMDQMPMAQVALD